MFRLWDECFVIFTWLILSRDNSLCSDFSICSFGKIFFTFSCFFFLFEVFLGLVFLYFYELCFVFGVVFDECRHVHLFLVLYMYCFE